MGLIGTHAEREIGNNGRPQLTLHIAPIAYHDAKGHLQRITNRLEPTGNPTFPIGVDELVQFRIRGKLTGNAQKHSHGT